MKHLLIIGLALCMGVSLSSCEDDHEIRPMTITPTGTMDFGDDTDFQDDTDFPAEDTDDGMSDDGTGGGINTDDGTNGTGGTGGTGTGGTGTGGTGTGGTGGTGTGGNGTGGTGGTGGIDY